MRLRGLPIALNLSPRPSDFCLGKKDRKHHTEKESGLHLVDLIGCTSITVPDLGREGQRRQGGFRVWSSRVTIRHLVNGLSRAKCNYQVRSSEWSRPLQAPLRWA